MALERVKVLREDEVRILFQDQPEEEVGTFLTIQTEHSPFQREVRRLVENAVTDFERLLAASTRGRSVDGTTDDAGAVTMFKRAAAGLSVLWPIAQALAVSPSKGPEPRRSPETVIRPERAPPTRATHAYDAYLEAATGFAARGEDTLARRAYLKYHLLKHAADDLPEILADETLRDDARRRDAAVGALEALVEEFTGVLPVDLAPALTRLKAWKAGEPLAPVFDAVIKLLRGRAEAMKVPGVDPDGGSVRQASYAEGIVAMRALVSGGSSPGDDRGSVTPAVWTSSYQPYVGGVFTEIADELRAIVLREQARVSQLARPARELIRTLRELLQALALRDEETVSASAEPASA